MTYLTGMHAYGQDSDDDIVDVDGNAMFDNPEPGEIPDLDKEIVVITGLESALESLVDLKVDIVTTGGMNRRFAMEAERILPGAITTPMDYFSNTTSATGLKVSVEEITTGIWALIAAASVAVIGLIVKIIGWLSGKKDDKNATPAEAKAKIEEKAEQVEKGKEILEETVADMREASHLIHNNPIEFSTANGHKVHYSKMDDVIAELFTDDTRYGRARKFLDEPNPVHMDIAHTGPYTKFMMQIAKSQLFHNIHNLLNDRVAELNSIAKDDIMAQGYKTVDLYKRLATLTKPVEVNFNGVTSTLSDLAKRFATARHSVEATTPEKNMHFDHLFNAIESAAKTRELTQTLHDAAAATPVLQDLKGAVGHVSELVSDLSVDGLPGGNNEGIAVRIRECIPVLGRDIAGFGSLIAEIEKYATDFNYLTREVVGFSQDIVRRVSTDMHKSGAEIPKEWKTLLDQRKRAMAVLNEAMFPGSKPFPNLH